MYVLLRYAESREGPPGLLLKQHNCVLIAWCAFNIFKLYVVFLLKENARVWYDEMQRNLKRSADENW